MPTTEFVDGKIQGVWGKNDKGVVIYTNVEGEDMKVNMDAQGGTVALG